jgi:hypothetical protein
MYVQLLLIPQQLQAQHKALCYFETETYPAGACEAA